MTYSDSFLWLIQRLLLRPRGRCIIHNTSAAMNAKRKKGEPERALFTTRTGTVHHLRRYFVLCTFGLWRRALIDFQTSMSLK